MSFVFDERQLINQRENRNLFRWQELNLALKRDKAIPHILLVNILIHNSDNCREALALFRFSIFQFWRIEKHPITGVHPLQGSGFAMIRLNKATRQAALNMVFRSNNDPILHRSLSLSSQSSEQGYERKDQGYSKQETQVIGASRVVYLIHLHRRVEKRKDQSDG